MVHNLRDVVGSPKFENLAGFFIHSYPNVPTHRLLLGYIYKMNSPKYNILAVDHKIE